MAGIMPIIFGSLTDGGRKDYMNDNYLFAAFELDWAIVSLKNPGKSFEELWGIWLDYENDKCYNDNVKTKG